MRPSRQQGFEVGDILPGPLQLPVAGDLQLPWSYHWLQELFRVDECELRAGNEDEDVNLGEVCKLGNVRLAHQEGVGPLTCTFYHLEEELVKFKLEMEHYNRKSENESEN